MNREKLAAACAIIQKTVPVVDKFQATLAELQRYAKQGNRGQVKSILLDRIRHDREAMNSGLEESWNAVSIIVGEMDLDNELSSEVRKRDMDKAREADVARKALQEARDTAVQDRVDGENNDGENSEPVLTRAEKKARAKEVELKQKLEENENANAEVLKGEVKQPGDDDKDETFE